MRHRLCLGVVLLICGDLLSCANRRPIQSDAHKSSLTPTLNADFGGLDGSWEGELTFLRGATLWSPLKTTGLRDRITVQGTSVRVYAIYSDRAEEVKPGSFHMEALMTNAVISATDSGKDNEGTWVETWVFSLTEKDKDTLLVNFSRIVNNIDLPLGNDHSKFALAATGELKRLPER